MGIIRRVVVETNEAERAVLNSPELRSIVTAIGSVLGDIQMQQLAGNPVPDDLNEMLNARIGAFIQRSEALGIRAKSLMLNGEKIIENTKPNRQDSLDLNKLARLALPVEQRHGYIADFEKEGSGASVRPNSLAKPGSVLKP